MTAGSAPYIAFAFSMLRFMMSVSSQCAMMGSVALWKSAFSTSRLSTSMLPVLEPINSFMPGTRCGSMSQTVSMLSLVAPMKKP